MTEKVKKYFKKYNSGAHKAIAVFWSVAVFMFGFALISGAAWNPPTANPPGGNAPTPLNVTGTFQSKSGPLTIQGSWFETYNETNLSTVGGGTTIGYDPGAIGAPPANGLIVEGAVGIGEISPLTNLHIVGGVTLEGAAAEIGVLDPQDLRLGVRTDPGGFTALCTLDSATGVFDCPAGFTSGGSSLSPWTRTGTNTHLVNSGDNVGIGTSNPLQKLDVAGLIRTASSGIRIPTGSAGLNIIEDSGASAAIKVGGIHVGGAYAGSDPVDGQIRTATTDISFLPGGAESVRFTQTGRTGIGTPGPGTKLHVFDTTDNLLRLERSTGTPTNFRVGTDGVFVVNADGSDTLFLDSGNLGVGTIPAAKLDVNGSVRLRTLTGCTLVTNGSGDVGCGGGSGIGIGGAANQTIRHNGTDWVASGALLNTGSLVEIASGQDTMFRLNRSGANPAEFRVGGGDGVLVVNADGSDTLFLDSGNLGVGGNPFNRLTVHGAVSIGTSAPWTTSAVGGFTSLSLEGRLGIGTMTPTRQLHVVSDGIHLENVLGEISVPPTQSIEFGHFDTATGFAPLCTLDAAGVLDCAGFEQGGVPIGGGGGGLWTDGGTTTYLTAAGDRLGIGTLTAQSKLEVTSAAGLNVNSPATFDTRSNYQLLVEADTASTAGLASGIMFGLGNSFGGGAILYEKVYGDGGHAGKMHFITRDNGVDTPIKMTITQNGRVGIGTTNPLSQLHTTGTVYFDCQPCGSTSALEGGEFWGNMSIQGRVLSADNNIHLSPPAGTNVIINDTYRAAGGAGSGSAGLRVEGDVGIGAADPASHMLDVASRKGSAGNSAIRAIYPSGGGLAGTEFGALAHRGGVWTAVYGRQGAASSAGYFDGRVGIGTTSPANYIGWPGALDVNGQVKGAIYYDDNPAYYADLNSGGNLGGNWKIGGAVSASNWVGAGCEGWCEGGGGYSLMYADGRIVASDRYYTADHEIIDTTPGSTYFKGNGNAIYFQTVNGTNTASMDNNGSVYAANSFYANGGFYYLSDIKLKENIEPLENSLDKILQLQGVSYHWKTDGELDMGLIAQDVEKIFPELVKTSMEPGSEPAKTINYGKLTGPIIEAIKEQQTQIDELKNDIEELKAQLNELK